MPLPALILIALGLAATVAFFAGIVSGVTGAGLNAIGALLMILGVLWSAVARSRSRKKSSREA